MTVEAEAMEAGFKDLGDMVKERALAERERRNLEKTASGGGSPRARRGI